MKFIAEVLAPDGGSDSLHVGIKDKGSAQTWHLGPGRLWMEPWIRGSTKRTFYVSRNVSSGVLCFLFVSTVVFDR